MCWNRNVSAAFATFEMAAILFIFIRSRLSSNHYVRRQWLVLPALGSICVMEIIEWMIWSRPEELISILDASSTTCSERNRKLTLFTWLALLPWQPLLTIMPCRRVGSTRNQELLKVPEMLAVVFAVTHFLGFLYVAFDANHPLVRPLEQSNYHSYIHSQSCIYVGQKGHLHWTLRIADTYITPNAFTYALLWTSIAYARPLRFAAGIFLAALVVFVCQLVYFGLSFEAGSVWCWTAGVLCLYFIGQPYLLPIDKTDCVGVDAAY
jgi:hypothetical protein